MKNLYDECDVMDDDGANYISQKMMNRGSSSNNISNHMKNIHKNISIGSSRQKIEPNIFFDIEQEVGNSDGREKLVIGDRITSLSKLGIEKRSFFNSAFKEKVLDNKFNSSSSNIANKPSSFQEYKQTVGSVRSLKDESKVSHQSYDLNSLQRTISDILDQKNQRLIKPTFSNRQRETSSSKMVKKMTSSLIKDPSDECYKVPEQRPGVVLSAIASLEDAKRRKVNKLDPSVVCTPGVVYSMQALEILSQQVDESINEQEEIERNLVLLKEANKNRTQLSSTYLRALSNFGSSLNLKRNKLIEEITNCENNTENLIEHNSEQIGRASCRERV